MSTENDEKIHYCSCGSHFEDSDGKCLDCGLQKKPRPILCRRCDKPIESRDELYMDPRSGDFFHRACEGMTPRRSDEYIPPKDIPEPTRTQLNRIEEKVDKIYNWLTALDKLR